ncbi:26S proteasome subunit P45 [Aureobasidium subglaciale]|nr:26S proteasome subunit P45 [Aureobasidium subglaciale]
MMLSDMAVRVNRVGLIRLHKFVTTGRGAASRQCLLGSARSLSSTRILAQASETTPATHGFSNGLNLGKIALKKDGVYLDTKLRISPSAELEVNERPGSESLRWDGERLYFENADGEDRTYVSNLWLRQIMFDKSIAANPPTVDYKDVMEADGIAEWTRQINVHGFSFVKNCPIDPDATQRLLETIGPIRETHYGGCISLYMVSYVKLKLTGQGGFYDFTSNMASKDTAYTSLALEAHTDTTYFSEPAGLQMFHMLSHTGGSGGESLLVDGFAAARQLYAEDKEAYKILSTIGVWAHASGNEDVSIQPYVCFPVLSHDPIMGHLVQVRWNNADRAAIEAPSDMIDKWYEAARNASEQETNGRRLQIDETRVTTGAWEMVLESESPAANAESDVIVDGAQAKSSSAPSTPSAYQQSAARMSTLEDLDALEHQDKKEGEDKRDGDEQDPKKPNQGGDADMKDADGDNKGEEEEEVLDSDILNSSTRDIVTRRRLLENDTRIMRSEFQRLTHEKQAMLEKIKDNVDKIDNNRQLPYLVGNVVEILDLDVEEDAAEEGANVDLDATRVGKSAVIKTSTRQTIFLPLIGLVDHEKLKPGDLIGVNKDSYLILDTLPAEYDSRVKAMEVDEKPTEKYTDVGGLDKQIEELVEAVVWPMKEAERFKKIGIKAPKGALMYGPPGTGKTLLARACAAQTEATFLKLAGPQLVQMFIGDGAKLVRDCFALAKEKAPSIIFIDELDAVGTKRFDSDKSGDREVQRTMLELLNQLDGFASDDRIKVLAATNRVDVLDPALLRSGRLDRKIEFPLPNEESRAQILRIHSRKMTVDEGVNWPELARSTDEFGGAMLKAVCVEAGMIALRSGQSKIIHEHYVDAIAEVQSKKKESISIYA